MTENIQGQLVFDQKAKEELATMVEEGGGAAVRPCLLPQSRRAEAT